MNVRLDTGRGFRTNAGATSRSMPSQPPVRRPQTSAQQLESSLPPGAKPWQEAVVSFLDFMSGLFS